MGSICTLRKLLYIVALLVTIISIRDAYVDGYGEETGSKVVQEVVKHLRGGRLAAAREEYLKRTSEEEGNHQDELEYIVDQIYEYGNMGQDIRVQDILEFARELSDAEAIIVLNKLMEEMRNTMFLNNNIQIFPISHRIHKILKSGSFEAVPKAQKSVIEELNRTARSLVQEMKLELATQVRRTEYSELRQASQDRQSFSPHLSSIVALAYAGNGSAVNFKSALNISSNVWYSDQVLEVYRALAKSLRTSGKWNSEEMITLTHEAFQFCDDDDKELPHAVRTRCKTSFRSLFDQDLWRLHDGKKCTIRATQFGDKLFASEEDAPQVFAWLHDFPEGSPDSRAYWTFEMSKSRGNGKSLPNVFRIRNVNTGEYLFQDEIYQRDRIQVKVASRPDKSSARWALAPQANGAFWIRNVDSQMYLYPAANDLNFSKEERRVFIWVPGDCDGQCRWNIKCN